MPDRARAAVDVPLQADVSMAEALVGAPIDANGNLTSDGTRTFEWDARNQLVAVTVGTHRGEFVYDGLQRRVRMIEKDAGVTTTDTRVRWCETAICEERAADGVTVTRRAFALGGQINGQSRFFTTDHLGSVREVTDAAGTLLARYAFDPWGQRTVTAGTDSTTVGFTGLAIHYPSSLDLALYRAYDNGLGRWLSRDPLGDVDGPNRYAYVANSPWCVSTISAFSTVGLCLAQRRDLQRGIIAAWTSCLNQGDRRVYWKEARFNPLVRREEWSKWKSDFGYIQRQRLQSVQRS